MCPRCAPVATRREGSWRTSISRKRGSQACRRPRKARKSTATRRSPGCAFARGPEERRPISCAIGPEGEDRNNGATRSALTGAVSLAEARKLAGKVLSDVRLGLDPAAAKRALAEAGERRRRSPSCWSATRRSARSRRRHRQGDGDDAPSRLCRSDRREPRSPDRDADGSWSSASSACATAFAATPRRGLGWRRPSALGSTACSRPASRAATSLANPLAGFREPRQSRAQRLEQAAKRVGRMLSMDEIAALWAACGDHRIRPAFGAYVRALIVLGSRRAETAAARLSWIKPATRRSAGAARLSRRGDKGRPRACPAAGAIWRPA